MYRILGPWLTQRESQDSHKAWMSSGMGTADVRYDGTECTAGGTGTHERHTTHFELRGTTGAALLIKCRTRKTEERERKADLEVAKIGDP